MIARKWNPVLSVPYFRKPKTVLKLNTSFKKRLPEKQKKKIWSQERSKSTITKYFFSN